MAWIRFFATLAIAIGVVTPHGQRSVRADGSVLFSLSAFQAAEIVEVAAVQQAVNINSEHKEAARAWIDWFTEKSGYVADNLLPSTLKDAPLPEALKPYEEAGVQLIEVDDSKGGVVKEIDNASEVGLYGPAYRQDLVDLARGAKDGDLDGFLADLGKRWTEAQKTVGS